MAFFLSHFIPPHSFSVLELYFYMKITNKLVKTNRGKPVF